MGSPGQPAPVKLVVGLLARELATLEEATTRLCDEFGPADYVSPLVPFTLTDYYAAEMGPDLQRQFVSFRRLIIPDELPGIKLVTNLLEGEFTPGGRRLVNVDPGYLSAGKFVLATSKNQQHRLYLGQGIYGEVALRYRDGAWQPWEWTYPDYRSPEYARILAEIRAVYMAQIRHA
jgi:hypothetical protein